MKKFVVYETETLRLVKDYEYAALALRYLEKMGAGYSMTDRTSFINLPVPMKKVRNLMSGAEIEIPVNTPRCCDPSTELYWSM